MRPSWRQLLPAIPLWIFSCDEAETKEPCAGDECVMSCPADLAGCFGECVNVNEDPAHCGACGSACSPEKFCVAGRCQAECGGQVPDRCGDRCVDRRSHPDHCGSCGVTCAEGQVCVAGSCAAACGFLAPAECGRTCVDPQNDSLHCGACGNRCPESERCVAGECGGDCAGERPNTCPDRCVDLQTDPLACGDCNQHCEATEVCSDGQCAVACEVPGTGACWGECLDLQRDPRACGQCGKRCRVGSVCSQGECSASCRGPGEVQCGDRCVLIEQDVKHCGECDNACEPGQLCSDGSCTSSGDGGAAGAGNGGIDQGGTNAGGTGTESAGAGAGGAGADSGGGGAGGECHDPRAWSGEVDDPNGVLYGAAELGVPGYVGGALSLPSAGSSLQAPDSDAIDMGVSDFSVAFFVQTTDTGGAMLDKRVGPPYRGYSVYFDSSAIGMQLADGDWQNFPATVTINDGQWHHVAITVDRDQADGLKFYIDGAFLTADDPTARSGDLSNTSPLFWGDNFDGGFSMIGLLDEMGLYQRVLTPEEIELLAQGQAVDGDVCE